MKYHTKTGSTYEVEGSQIRKLIGGAGTNRIAVDWRTFESLEVTQHGLVIFWGVGRDAVSDVLGTEGDNPARYTTTSPIVREEP